MPTRHAGSFWKNAMTCQALQLPANNHLADSINTVHLKDRLSDIKTDCCDRLHAWLLRIVGASTGSTSMALACRWRSRPQHQYRTHAAQQDCSAILDHTIRSNPSPTRRTFVTLGTKKCVGAIAQPSSAQRTRNARRDTAASSGISQNPVFTSGSSTCNG